MGGGLLGGDSHEHDHNSCLAIVETRAESNRVCVAVSVEINLAFATLKMRVNWLQNTLNFQMRSRDNF